ncbi:MAG TPA: hypothetical protein DD490_09225 [Acidobacteria bacterium]|nr:hypothetical protein [Acidobacteriota bacterium]
MHRRMSQSCALALLLVVLMVGAVPASAEPQKAASAPVVESTSLLGWAWDWLTSLIAGDPVEGANAARGVDGGVFMDPLGGNG